MCINTIKLKNAGNRPRPNFKIYFEWGHRAMQTAGSSKTGFVRLYLLYIAIKLIVCIGYWFEALLRTLSQYR